MPYYSFSAFNSSYSLYILLVIPAFILSLIAQGYVKSTYRKMSKLAGSTNCTGATAAQAVLAYYGVTNVQIAQCSGRLSDHFDPRNNTISLSREVYYSNSIAAIGIACHEAGHAAQHAEGYVPIKIRNAIIPVCNIGSYAGIPLAFLGYFLSFEPLIIIGLALYSAIAVFQLATLPVEFNASRRAIFVIEEQSLLSDAGERKKAKRVLRAAAMTYVAALAVTLANLLRFIIMFTGRGKRK